MSGRANSRFWAFCLVLVASAWGPYAAAQPAVGAQPPDPAGALAPAAGAAANAQPGLQAVLLEVQNQLGKIDQRLKAVEERLAGGVPAPAAVPVGPVGAVDAIAGSPPVVQEPGAPVGTPPTVSPDFWTVENAERMGVYRFEPRIKEAARILADVFSRAAVASRNAQTAAELEQIPGKFRKDFLDQLTATGRTDFTIEVWRSAANQWFMPVNAALEGQKFAGYQDILARAFEDGAKNVVPWGDAIEARHIEAAKVGELTGAAAAAAASGRAGGGAGGVGYLPPLAAFHYSWHVRKVNRLNARIQLYSGR